MDPEQLMISQGGWLRAQVYVLVLLIADIDITCASCTAAEFVICGHHATLSLPY